MSRATARSSPASGTRDALAREGSRLTDPNDTPGQDRPRPDDRSLHELIRDLADGTARLVRDEIALAKLELRRSAERMGAGAAAYAVAALLALAVLGLLVATLVLAFDLVLPAWAATLVVAVLLALLAAGAAAAGRALIAQGRPDVAEHVREGLREDVATIRASVSDQRREDGRP